MSVTREMRVSEGFPLLFGRFPRFGDGQGAACHWVPLLCFSVVIFGSSVFK